MLKLCPLNRHLLVIPAEVDPAEGQVLLPDGYKATKIHEKYCVLGISEDVSLGVSINDTIVVEESMVQAVEIGEQTNYMVLENYVLGIVRNE